MHIGKYLFYCKCLAKMKAKITWAALKAQELKSFSSGLHRAPNVILNLSGTGIWLRFLVRVVSVGL